MEALDTQILALLATDGRMSYTDIGKATGLSTSAAQQRVRRLEQRGVITGYRADINPESLGKLLMALVSVRSRDAADEDALPARLAELPAIESCYSVAGQAGYVLKVFVESPGELEHLLRDIRQCAPSCSTETQLVLSVPFQGRPLV